MMNGVFSQSKLGRSIVLVLAAALFASANARADLPRRISASFQPSYYIFDSSYFNLENGFGVNAAFRYELGSDIYFENSIGLCLERDELCALIEKVKVCTEEKHKSISREHLEKLITQVRQEQQAAGKKEERLSI